MEDPPGIPGFIFLIANPRISQAWTQPTGTSASFFGTFDFTHATVLGISGGGGGGVSINGVLGNWNLNSSSPAVDSGFTAATIKTLGSGAIFEVPTLPAAFFYSSGNTFNLGSLGTSPQVTPAISINSIVGGGITFNGTAGFTGAISSQSSLDLTTGPALADIPASSAVVNHLTKLDASGNAALVATSDVTGVIGCIALLNGGTASVAIGGTVQCMADGPVLAGDYLIISPMTAGDVDDSNLAPPQVPPSGSQVVGQALNTIGSAGLVRMLVYPASTETGFFSGVANQITIQALSAGVPSGVPVSLNVNPGGSGSQITIPNSAGVDAFALLSATQTISNKTIGTAGGNILKLGSQSITSVSGNTGVLASTTGVFISGNCVKTDANHNFIDAAGTCGGGTGSPGGSDTQVQYNNTGSFAGVASFTINDSTGVITVKQPANNVTALIFKRFTDTVPTGKLFDIQNAAGGSLGNLDNAANLTVASLTATAPVTAANGGTGLATLGANCVLLGNGTGTLHSACPVLAGDVLTDNGSGADPTFQAGGGGGGGVIKSPTTNTANKVLPTSDAVALSVQGKTGGVADVFEAFGQALMQAPSAPTLGSVAGGSLGAATYYAVDTCIDNVGGETIVSAEPGQQSVGASNFLTVQGPSSTTAPAGCVGYRVYVTLTTGAPGTETLQTITSSQCTLAVGTAVNACALGTTWTQTAATTSGTAVPGSSTAKIKSFWIDASGNANFAGTLYGFENSVFFPGVQTALYTAQNWTLPRNITITRVQVTARVGPNGCSPNVSYTITDGTTALVVGPLTTSTFDSGVISQNYSSGSVMQSKISTAAAGCVTTTPTDVNMVIEYGVH